jgi:DNA (cytosine-5)-methyltransferase 1
MPKELWPKTDLSGNKDRQVGESEKRRQEKLFRTPAASEAERGHQTESVARARGGQVTLSGQMKELFPTPIVSDWKNGISSPGYGMNLPMTAKSLLPTPTVSDNRGASRGEVEKGNPKHRLKVEVELLPTPNTMEHREIKTPEQIQAMKDKSPGGYRNLRESVVNEMPETNWGKFEAAIRRWQEVIGRPAPAPTKPDGKDGAHRLSSLFTEWLMGLPEGWITGLGLKRNDELKLAGNGVVPQQAELALRILLEDDNLLERIKK